MLRRGQRLGRRNYNHVILYQRLETGALSAATKLNAGRPLRRSAELRGSNSDNSTSLHVTNLPATLIPARGAMIYVTEIYTTHS